MNIWLDLTNSPHVNFFAGIIRELRDRHTFTITCRPLSNTIDLLELEGLPYHVVGAHYGASRVRKVAGFAVRVLQLRRFLRGRRIDAAAAHSSYYAPLAAATCRIPSLYINDNEHASGNWAAIPFAREVMVPEHLYPRARRAGWGLFTHLSAFPGVKEGVYLWPYRPAESIPPTLAAPPGMKRIFVRPEPWAAHYYHGRRDFLDGLLAELARRHAVFVLPRDPAQRAHYATRAGPGLTVVEKAVGLPEIMAACDLFIGAGGTMTREAAILGVPTISIYQDSLLSVDRYLIAEGAMIHDPALTPARAEAVLAASGPQARRTTLLDKGRQAYTMIRDRMLSLPDNT